MADWIQEVQQEGNVFTTRVIPNSKSSSSIFYCTFYFLSLFSNSIIKALGAFYFVLEGEEVRKELRNTSMY